MIKGFNPAESGIIERLCGVCGFITPHHKSSFIPAVFGTVQIIEVIKCNRCFTTGSIVNPKGVFSENFKPFVLRLKERPRGSD